MPNESKSHTSSTPSHAAASPAHVTGAAPAGKAGNPDTSSAAQRPSFTDKFPQLKVLPSSDYVLSLMSTIRNRQCARKDFVHAADQLLRITCEYALNFLPYEPKVVKTPTDEPYEGVVLNRAICGVSVLRSGEAMEAALRSCIPQAKIGKMLIQRDESSPDKAAKLFYTKLPDDIKSSVVLLMDPMLATGGTACAAIQVLNDVGVRQQDIVMVSLLAAPEGVQRVLEKYPHVTIAVNTLDHGLNDQKYIVPGLGDFGDLYYGTHSK